MSSLLSVVILYIYVFYHELCVENSITTLGKLLN